MTRSHGVDSPPLVTGRSPSTRRAVAERDNPSPTADAEVVGVLNRLVELERDAAAACAAARASMSNADGDARERGAAHEARANELAAAVERLGGIAPEADQCEDALRSGPQGVMNEVSDEGILRALDCDVLELADAYRRATHVRAMGDEEQALLARLRRRLLGVHEVVALEPHWRRLADAATD